MANVNIESIINSPEKKLLRGFKELRDNYTTESAQAYSELYKTQPASFILENSRYIFAEPQFGLPFYRNFIEHAADYAITTQLPQEHTKLRDYIIEHADKMSAVQEDAYKDAYGSLEEYEESMKETIACITYALEDAQEESLARVMTDAMYEYVNDPCDAYKEIVESTIESMENPYVKYPYSLLAERAFVECEGSSVTMNNTFQTVQDNYAECTQDVEYDIINEEPLKNYAEQVVILGRLMKDQVIQEAVSTIRNRETRMMLKEMAQSSLADDIENIFTESVDKIETYYASPEGAVNSIFDAFEEDAVYDESTEIVKKNRASVKHAYYEAAMDMVMRDYTHSTDVTAEAVTTYGGLCEESTTVEEAFHKISEMYMESCDALGLLYMNESESEEESKESEDDGHYSSTDASKKVKAPKAKNLANKIQHKAMDTEVKQQKAMANAKQAGQEVKNAAKAVTALPSNVVNDVKAQIHNLDEKDDDRRKKYMSEPGFRKKAFRNLKLAIMYGSAATCKLAFVPYVAIMRHFSKEKDRRVRNELIRELDTEIKICDEKINDANAAGDNQQKYQLMRIKSKLDAEMVRVKANSKYI